MYFESGPMLRSRRGHDQHLEKHSDRKMHANPLNHLGSGSDKLTTN